MQIRSPIYTRKTLFDVGVAGPIAGFVCLTPFLVAGVWMSRVSPGGFSHGPFVFGTPLILRALEWIRFPGVPPLDILMHPMAVAAWAGLLSTAMNLLPTGQIDGGHLVYAVFGERAHRLVTRLTLAGLALLGILYWPWLLCAAGLFFFGRRHPLVYDQTPVSGWRIALSGVMLVMFVACFSVFPVRAD